MTTRFAFLAAPALLFAYGTARLIDGLDGTHGPGPAWTTGHIFFLTSILLFGVALIGLRGRLEGRGHRRIGTVAAVAGLIGLVAFVRTTIIDLIVGLRGTDRADMDRLYPHYDRWPGGLPTALTGPLDKLGPALFMLSLLTLTILLVLARPRLLSWWSPVLVVVALVAISTSLDLLPLAGAALFAALWPVARQRSETRAVATV
ncbi:MAG TPA: hypothetical protein VGJ28_10945 [Micromonosporaceae bacterium]